MKTRPFNKLFVAAVGFAICASAHAYSGLFVFGDSLSDSGNAAAAGFYDPAQVVTGNTYVPSAAYASGTFSNGSVWATQFATSLGLTLSPSFTGGTNFAVGGAKTGEGVTREDPYSLRWQVKTFISALGVNPAPSDALYVIAGGGNNARGALEAIGGGASFFSTVGSASFNYANDVGTMIDQLQAKGVANSNIIVWNTPNVGLAPAVAATGFGSVGTQVSEAMNGALSARLAGETGVKVFDVFSLVGQASANGFTNTTAACGALSNSLACAGGIGAALFWDGIHPTTAAHSLISQQMFALAVPEPSEIAMMLVGLLVVVGAARRKAA